MIVCPRCGNENLEGSKFCSNCGNSLTVVERPAVKDESIGDLPEPPDLAPSSPSPSRAEAQVPPPIPAPRAWSPRPSAARNEASVLPATAPEWRMSDAGPLPEPRRRRTWLWIVVGLLGACLLICVGLIIWGNTESGTRVLNDLATSVAEAATPQAEATGTPQTGE